MKLKNTQIAFVGITFLLCIEFVLCKDIPFFGDAISKLRRANWFYQNNFSQFVIPTHLNSGHLPLWEFILASFWSVFGKTLVVSRLLMLLVNVFLFSQIIQFIHYFFTDKWFFIALFFVCIEPTLLAQTTFMNNDILLLSFVFLSLNALLYHKKTFLIIGLIGVLFANLRGIPLFFGLASIGLIFAYLNYTPFSIKKLGLYYLLAFIPFGVFLFYQYSVLGWIIKSPSPNWIEQRGLAEFSKLIKNIAELGWNFLVFGRFTLIIPLLFLVFIYYKKKLFSHSFIRLSIIALVLFILMCVSTLPFTNPIGMRYFMVIYVLCILIFIEILRNLNFSKKIKSGLLFTILTGFLTAHLWVFPPKIPQAWDCTLVYLNFYSVEKKMISYIHSNQINRFEIGTNAKFNFREFSRLRANSESEEFADLNINTNDYILFSTVENNTSDGELDYITTLPLVKEFWQNGVRVSLYKNIKKAPN